MTEKEESIENILENLVYIYRRNECANRNIRYNRFLEDIFNKGADFAVNTISRIYSIGRNYMDNGRGGDGNLFNTLNSLNVLISRKNPELGKKCEKELTHIYAKNWALLETL